MADLLAPLVADGVVEDIISRLKTGKEAEIFMVQHAGEICAAKVYKERHARNFKNNAAYLEGRSSRNTRTQRAMDKGSRFGQRQSEEAWKAKEYEALIKLHAAGIRVPQPIMMYEGVLLMEVVIDPEGHPAPRLIDAAIPQERAAEYYADLRSQVIRILMADLIHGDLSPYNILLAWNGPTIIDFPQVVGAAHNSQARMFFMRDLNTVQQFFAAIDPALNACANDAAEIWRAYERRELTADFVPTGKFVDDRPQRHERAHGHPREGRGGAPRQHGGQRGGGPVEKRGGARGGGPVVEQRGGARSGGPVVEQRGGARSGGPVVEHRGGARSGGPVVEHRNAGGRGPTVEHRGGARGGEPVVEHRTAGGRGPIVEHRGAHSSSAHHAEPGGHAASGSAAAHGDRAQTPHHGRGPEQRHDRSGHAQQPGGHRGDHRQPRGPHGQQHADPNRNDPAARAHHGAPHRGDRRHGNSEPSMTGNAPASSAGHSGPSSDAQGQRHGHGSHGAHHGSARNDRGPARAHRGNPQDFGRAGGGGHRTDRRGGGRRDGAPPAVTYVARAAPNASGETRDSPPPADPKKSSH